MLIVGHLPANSSPVEEPVGDFDLAHSRTGWWHRRTAPLGGLRNEYAHNVSERWPIGPPGDEPARILQSGLKADGASAPSKSLLPD